MKLDERLSLCAEFVRQGAKTADIGTDHAYLPVYLVQSGRTDFAVAADVRVGPLENARGNIAESGLENKIKTVLSDGLEKISPDEAEDIVIAGMGSELMIRIIEAAPWLRDSTKHLILQPMTRAEQLREYLCRRGFRIESEKACISCKKTYSVMLCIYDGIVRDCDDHFRYIGMLENDPGYEAKRYIYVITEKLRKKLRGFQPGTDEYVRTERLINEFSTLCPEQSAYAEINGGEENDSGKGNI